MKFILFISLLVSRISFSQSCSFVNDSSILCWQQRSLKANDFVYRSSGNAKFGKIEKGTPYAQIVTSIKHCFYVRNDTVYLKVFSIMDKNLSTTNLKVLTERDIEHEQLHFDITEYFKRMCWKTILQLEPKNESEVLNILTKSAEECKILQDDYDNETIHGQDSVKQCFWRQKIKSLFQNTLDYNNVEYRIPKPDYKIIWKASSFPQSFKRFELLNVCP